MKAKKKQKGCRVVQAKNFCAMWGEIPELNMVLEEGELQDMWSSLMDRLLKNGTWYRAAGDDLNGSLIYANDGDFYTSRRVKFDPNGRYSVKGSDGTTWRYSWFGWSDLTYLPELGEMVTVDCMFKNTSNIQQGIFAKSLVEAKIKEAGLEYTIQNGRVQYTGPKDRFREVRVYPNCNGLTWGVYFLARAYEGARKVEDWGGAYWPDEATAKSVAAQYLKDGTKAVCANLNDLKARFPDYPIVAQMEAYEAERDKKKKENTP